MKFILKLIADLCFYFTFAPLLIFFVPPFTLIFPAIAYIAFFIYSSRNFTHVNDHRRIFKFYAKAVAVIVVTSMIAQTDYHITILPVILLFFASSIAFLRLSRYDAEIQTKSLSRVISSIPVVALFIAAVITASNWFTGLLTRFYHDVLVNIFMLIIRILLFVFAPIINWLIIRLEDYEPTYDEETANIGEIYGRVEEIYFTQRLNVTTMATGIIISAIAVFIMVWLARELVTQLLRKVVEKNVDQEYIPLDKNANQRSGKTKNKMRKQYRRFLAKCWKKKIPKEGYFTSATYHKLATKEFGNDIDLAKLRELYLPVRYGNKLQEDAAPADIAYVKKLIAKLGRYKSKL